MTWRFTSLLARLGLVSFLLATAGSTATGASASARPGGVRLDMRADFGAACDGSINDTKAFNAMLTSVGSTPTPVTVSFPGACLISPSNYSASGDLSFLGVSGGGIKLTGAQLGAASTVMKWTGYYQIYITDFTLDLNSSPLPANNFAYGFAFSGTASPNITNSHFKNATAPTGGIAAASILSAGTGWTPSVTNGLIIFNGTGCSIKPVLTVSTNASGAITASGVATAGVCTEGIYSGSTTWAANGNGITTTGSGSSFAFKFKSSSSILVFVPNSNTSSSIIQNNTFAFNSTSMFGNEGVQWEGDKNIINNNKFENTGMATYSNGQSTITKNIINGWGYGGGITVEPLYANEGDTTMTQTLIEHNSIMNAAASLDQNNTKISGLEIGYDGIVVAGNDIYKACGPGITIYGRSTIVGNKIADSGTCNNNNLFYTSGIAAESATGPKGTSAASNSYIADNTVVDDGGGHTSYGYADVNSVSGIVLGVNNFKGGRGAYKIQSRGATFSTAPAMDVRSPRYRGTYLLWPSSTVAPNTPSTTR
jgi:hypothetical protein